MKYIDNLLFLLLLLIGFFLFFRGIYKIYRNIKLGKPIQYGNKKERWLIMLRLAFGQGKMKKKPVAGILHLFVYLGFLVINLELAEFIIDGLFGSHRFFSEIVGDSLYRIFTCLSEIFALLIIISVFIFFIRRNFFPVSRLSHIDLKGWAKQDANWILIMEFILMIAFLKINATDYQLQIRGISELHGSFPISNFLFGNVYSGLGDKTLYISERFFWWFHFIGILFFMNYLYHSKHLHIIFAFPNIWFAKLDKKGKLNNLNAVTKEVKFLINPETDSYSTLQETENHLPERFGVADIFDLNQSQLLNAYACTECGRCTSLCPANLTGKKLSPRKIMMATRDRLEEVGKIINKKGYFEDDNKKLLDDYISREELWACTTCNACTEACPIMIDPLSIIIDMRRYLVMEQSSAPHELNTMMNNIENNAAPWQYNQADRMNWAHE